MPGTPLPRRCAPHRPPRARFVGAERLSVGRAATAKEVAVDPAKYLRNAALADARGEVLMPQTWRVSSAGAFVAAILRAWTTATAARG
jgi:hypothetical protein